jgi:hypothetical protein
MAKKGKLPQLLLNEATLIEASQPDYDKWNSVTVGMNRQEVYKLLGQPLRGPHGFYQPHHCSFGYLQFPLMPCLPAFSFDVRFRQNRVVEKTDPFDGILSPNGLPSIPKIITPLAGSIFTHSPGYLDIRWYPASGVYPMFYDLDLRYGGEYGTPHIVESIPLPYHVCFVSTTVRPIPVCLRLRGRNRLGMGEWSGFRHFEWVQPPYH